MIKIMLLCVMAVLYHNVAECGDSRGNDKLKREINTGDVKFDEALKNLNESTKGDIGSFVFNMSKMFNIPKDKINKIMTDDKMDPSDVFMTLKLSSITNKPLDDVSKEFKDNRGRGWGVIAKRLGIKPGSKEFHELKNSGKKELEKIKGKKRGKGKEKEDGKGKKKKWQKTQTERN